MLIFLFLFAFGLGSLYYSYRIFSQIRQVKNWVKVKVQVAKAEIADSQTAGGGPPAFRKIKDMQYNYFVDNRQFTGKTFYSLELVGELKTDEKTHRKDYARFARGPQVGYYNPENPSEIYLVQSSRLWAIVTLIVGLLLLIISPVGFVID